MEGISAALPEPFTEVLGGPDMHVDQGSTINLTCVSKFNPTPPSDVTWYLNDKVSNAGDFWLSPDPALYFVKLMYLLGN